MQRTHAPVWTFLSRHLIKAEVGSRGACGAGPATAAVIKTEVGSRGACGAGPATAAVIERSARALRLSDSAIPLWRQQVVAYKDQAYLVPREDMMTLKATRLS